jgi:hypothetical protein
VLSVRPGVRPEDERVADEDIDADPRPVRMGGGERFDDPPEGALVVERSSLRAAWASLMACSGSIRSASL